MTTNSFLIPNRRHVLISPAPQISLDLDEFQVDTRPHEQRAQGPRLARRLNHAFKYLYRQDVHAFQNISAFEYLSQYYSEEQIRQMNASFPPLLDLNVSRHVHPKIRFLQETMGIETISAVTIPPQYFGARLERTIAPRHAFLVFHGLPHGRDIVVDHPQLWQEFLSACRQTKRFCALCNQWKEPSDPIITAKQIEAFDVLFGRGLLAAARDDLCQTENSWPLRHMNITSSQVLRLLIQHGANPLERDVRGASLLHWAAGTGNLGAVKVLLEYIPDGGVTELAERDGATPLHWACAGAKTREFGTGGHPEVCRYLLSVCESKTSPSKVTAKELVNMLTYDGNSPLMWASWSGTLDTVKMMIRNRADTKVANRNGCTVAHWAASGGSLEVCQYLADVAGVDFSQPNYGGNTPLSHAVAFGRVDVVDWLVKWQRTGGNDHTAARLAEDFYQWTDGDARRKQILQLFRDDYWDDSIAGDDNDDDDDEIHDRTVQNAEIQNYY